MEYLGRLAAFGAIVISAVVIVMNFLCVPMLLKQVAQMKAWGDGEMKEFKVSRIKHIAARIFNIKRINITNYT